MTLLGDDHLTPRDLPLDFGSGVRGEWRGAALWLERRGERPFFTYIQTGTERREAPPVWRVVQREPLTLEPSIKVSTTASGREVVLAHGYIRNGRWEDA